MAVVNTIGSVRVLPYTPSNGKVERKVYLTVSFSKQVNIYEAGKVFKSWKYLDNIGRILFVKGSILS